METKGSFFVDWWDDFEVEPLFVSGCVGVDWNVQMIDWADLRVVERTF